MYVLEERGEGTAVVGSRVSPQFLSYDIQELLTTLYPICLFSRTISSMFHLEDVLQLKDAEDVRLFVRRHPMTLTWPLLGALVLIALPFFFLFPLFALGALGIVLFCVSIFAGILLALRTLLIWDSDVFIITTLRLIDVDQRGLWSRFVTETPLEHIQDTRWERRGVFCTLFRVGSITVKATGLEQPMIAVFIPHPEQIHELVNDLRHATAPMKKEISPDVRQRLRAVMTTMEALPIESIEKIERLAQEESKKTAVRDYLEKPSRT